MRRYGSGWLPLTLVAGYCAFAPLALAQEVWSGRTHVFEKVDFADWTQPENQDHLTDRVWITRASSQGIFNIALEDHFFSHVSPQDTEWATGDAANWANLIFTDWQTWTAGIPPSTVGVDAVVHLVTDDIYVDIRFESWTASAQGGGFRYVRGVSSTPATSTTWGAVKALFE
jgi:hypothetical protein